MEYLNNDEIVIRPFTHQDTKLVWDFFDSLSLNTRSFFPGYPFTGEEAAKLTGDDVDNPDTRRFLASICGPDEEIMVGYVWFWNWTKRVPWFGICVKDRFQGAGLGKKLMAHAIGEANSCNKGGILLTTRKDNFRGQALYKGSGYELIGEDSRGEYLYILYFEDNQDMGGCTNASF